MLLLALCAITAQLTAADYDYGNSPYAKVQFGRKECFCEDGLNASETGLCYNSTSGETVSKICDFEEDWAMIYVAWAIAVILIGTITTTAWGNVLNIYLALLNAFYTPKVHLHEFDMMEAPASPTASPRSSAKKTSPRSSDKPSQRIRDVGLDESEQTYAHNGSSRAK